MLASPLWTHHGTTRRGRITNRLIVAPVVSTLVYENIPREVGDWAPNLEPGVLHSDPVASVSYTLHSKPRTLARPYLNPRL
jgi:hypothetical protein